VLKALWKHGPATVRALSDRLRCSGRRWAYTTVLTLLGRLVDKGYVKRDDSGFAHVFQAAVSSQAFLGQRLGELVDQICDGTATPLLQALVEGHRFTPKEIEGFRELLDELETEKKPPRTKRAPRL